MQNFPIDTVKENIIQSLESLDFLVIKSTPGSGKTTRVPLFLREHYSKKIYILEPRKLAAKLASTFVAQNLGEVPGGSIGHIFKYERAVSEKTQIIFLTEGTFLRILAQDPELLDCDVVILDEFHERHFNTDVALSFLLKIKERNKNLKIIIMSATINLKELDELLKDKGRTIEVNETKHKLRIHHLPNDTLVLKDSLEKKVYKAISDIHTRPGHILVFLPGMFEIRKCEEIIKNNFDYEVIILHSEVGITIDDSFYNLSKKKIILSTNIAESSVTIPGVRAVIDSGLHKTNRINPVTRLPMVELKKISQSSAIQRANRASREVDGEAFRLYAEFDYQNRDQFDTPEINRVDLSELVLSSAEIFKQDISEFKFLSKLSDTEVQKSKKYLSDIGLLENGKFTESARRIAKFPFHPRISKIMDEASKGDSLSFNAVVNYLADMVEPKSPGRFKTMVRSFFSPKNSGKSIDLEKIILYGYIDQIAKLKGSQLIHQNGEVYTISPKLMSEIDPHHPLWIILDLDNRNQITRILPIEEEWLYDLPTFPIEENSQIDLDTETFKISIERSSRIGAIVLSKEKVNTKEFNDEVLELAAKKLIPLFQNKLGTNMFKRLLVLEKYTTKKIADYDFFSWFKNQVHYLLSDNTYNLDSILNAYVEEIFTYLNSEMLYSLDSDLPLNLQLHDKRKVEIHYDASNGIHCESYIQDFFGLTTVPTILKGLEKIKIHLLGPHKRALQVTTDLMSFWDKAYKELYPELKRDYPRHHWATDPKSAKPILLLKNVI